MRLFPTFILLLITVIVAQSQVSDLQGVVRLEDKQVAIGAYVLLENTNFQTVTDIDGKYSLKDIPAGDYQLKVSYIGTADYRKILSIPSTKSSLNIILQSSSEILNEVMVVAKSESREQQEQAIEIESIEIKELLSQIKDISEAIDQMSGVAVRGSGSFGDPVDISINGLNGTAVRTYIDGLPMDFVYPQFSFNNLPIDNIKRVDVYKGVLPITVGTDALGGGINVVTQQKPFNEIKASYGLGSFNTHQANASVNLALTEDVTLNVNGTYNSSTNNFEMEAYIWEERERAQIERFHDNYKIFFGSTSLNIRNKNWADNFLISLNYGDYSKDLQHGGQIGNIAFGAANYRGDALSTRIDYQKSLGAKLKLTTSINYSNSNVIFTDTTANVYSWSGEVVARRENQPGEFGGESLSDRNFKNYINRINLTYALSDKDELTLTNLVAHQNTIGRDETRPVEKDFLTKSQYLTKDIVGLQYQRKLLEDKMTLSIAGKGYFFDTKGIEILSFTEVTKSDKRFGYYGAAKYNLSDRFFIRGSFESALRIPTFGQFFGNGATIISNVELKPESSDNVNLGFSYRSPSKGSIKYGVEFNTFLRGQNDIIYLTVNQFQQYRNAEEVRTQGIEGDVFVEFWNKLILKVNVTRLQQTYESISDRNITAQFLEGTTFPNVPSFFTNARLSYKISNLFQTNNRLTLYVQHKYVDEFNFINVGKIYDPKNYVPVQHRIDAGLNFTLLENKINLAFNVNNIFNAANFDNFSIPRPGRNFNTKLTYRLFDF